MFDSFRNLEVSFGFSTVDFLMLLSCITEQKKVISNELSDWSLSVREITHFKLFSTMNFFWFFSNVWNRSFLWSFQFLDVYFSFFTIKKNQNMTCWKLSIKFVKLQKMKIQYRVWDFDIILTNSPLSLSSFSDDPLLPWTKNCQFMIWKKSIIVNSWGNCLLTLTFRFRFVSFFQFWKFFSRSESYAFL